MTQIIDPSKIKLDKTDIYELKITPYRTEMKFGKDSDEEVCVSFTDEEGSLTPDEIGELYWILTTFLEYERQDIIGVYYNDKLVALWMLKDENDKHYITWDNLGVLVVSCLEGIKYQKEKSKNE